MPELDDQDRVHVAHALGMKVSEVVDVVDVGDGWIVTTHDQQQSKVSEDGTVAPLTPRIIEPVDTAPAEEVEDEVPNAKAEVVLDWVSQDQERATRALAAEQARDKPRSTLIAALEQLAQA